MTRDQAIARARDHLESGAFRDDLARRVAMPTMSQDPERREGLRAYLDEIMPALARMGFSGRVVEEGGWPFLLAERIEDPGLPTVLAYGHGDVVRGLDAGWAEGLSPWRLVERDGRWYGRGVTDNKGQHGINLAALDAVLLTRGRLGFNVKWLVEMGEEAGSPGLRETCARHAGALAADVLIASDGPRLSAGRPTLFLGSRGGLTFDLTIEPREGGHHSGNWGGLLSDPAIQLAHAVAAICSPTGQIRLPDWVPERIPDNVRRVLAGLEVDGGPDGPAIDPGWGEPGLTPAERVFGWCSFTVLALEAGNPRTPVNAVPPRAWARCQLRFVVGINVEAVLPALRRHLARQGLPMVEVSPAREEIFRATRLDPDDPWVAFAAASLEATTGQAPAILPNLGGSLPNDVFAEGLGLPTVWVPHSYPACSQHAPDEHLPIAVAREGLEIMAGLYWDVGERGAAVRDAARGRAGR
jgi:acetylornithine deacetylase/succinyl-diaminopimelate desuccinylase-like protein